MQTERQAHVRIDRYACRQTGTYAFRQADKQTCSHSFRQTEKTDISVFIVNRQARMQTDRHV